VQNGNRKLWSNHGLSYGYELASASPLATNKLTRERDGVLYLPRSSSAAR
jgi:hypothetical protein